MTSVVAETDALADVCVGLDTGASIALLGANDSGKTTFLDLLLGFRRTTGGRIGWIGPEGNRASSPRTSAAFQSVMRYEAPLADNVAFGDWSGVADPTPSRHDAAAVSRVLDEVGCASLPLDLPEGFMTLVGSRWPDSRGLSGGQWQPVAIARCLYASYRGAASSPQLRVLDEASSALDAQAEADLRAVLLGAALPEDGLTIFVTHRFPIIRVADVILVFENGRLVEQGEHRQLLALDGVYTALFAAQARGYGGDD
ncbi:MAG: ABC transporter ATP-binding protein/permease [Actinomycetia bacterium]|nr:ABC transporter ATP-binding protein/permease [Actinomycetes bacterium]